MTYQLITGLTKPNQKVYDFMKFKEILNVFTFSSSSSERQKEPILFFYDTVSNMYTRSEKKNEKSCR